LVLIIGQSILGSPLLETVAFQSQRRGLGLQLLGLGLERCNLANLFTSFSVAYCIVLNILFCRRTATNKQWACGTWTRCSSRR